MAGGGSGCSCNCPALGFSENVSLEGGMPTGQKSFLTAYFQGSQRLKLLLQIRIYLTQWTASCCNPSAASCLSNLTCEGKKEGPANQGI